MAETNDEGAAHVIYPSREAAMRYRSAVHDAVNSARKGRALERNALAWPPGLCRSLIRGLPLPTHSRNALGRSGIMDGDDALTVARMLSTPELGETTVRNPLLAMDEFLDQYIVAFEYPPGPVDIALMRLTREVRSLTSIEVAIVDERLLKDPPTPFHPPFLRLDL